jgi:PKD repeat protein
MTASSTDPQSSPVTYSWDFGDGTTGTGASVTHTYAAEGTFALRVTARNELNLSTTGATVVVVAYQPMSAPSIFGANTGHFLGQTFTASTVFLEPNKLPFTGSWDFGDGATASAADAVHTYAATGTYTAKFTVTNSLNRSSSASVVVNVMPRSVLPARADNVFGAFCTGAFCGAADADTYSGSGIGIWRYHNATGSAASINVVIDGVQAGQTASLVFTNGQSVATPTAPAIGDLASSISTQTTLTKPGAGAAAALAHAQMLESNFASAREYLRTRGRAKATPTSQKPAQAAALPPELGSARTWNDVSSGTSYAMQVGATCALPGGRNAVFWIDSAQVTDGRISTARIQYLVDAFCGMSGAYAQLTNVVGDVWGPAAAGSGYIEDAPGALQDLHIVIPGVQGVGWGGYFSSTNLVPKSTNPDSNEALAIFLNPSNLILNPGADAFTGSTLIHELKHHINFYERTVVRGNVHAPWLEETSAMLAEDFLTPAFFDASRTFARHSGYLFSTGVGYIGWTHPQGQSYNLGATFGGFMHRWYGLDVDRKLITDCDDQDALQGYQCMDDLIVSEGGVSFADEFARMGATVFGGMALGDVPDGFGLPSTTAEGFLLESLDSTATRRPNLATPGPLSAGDQATAHVYHLDIIAAGQTVYRRNNVQIPSGATLIVVVQQP